MLFAQFHLHKLPNHFIGRFLLAFDTSKKVVVDYNRYVELFQVSKYFRLLMDKLNGWATSQEILAAKYDILFYKRL
jgi:hypothetical protein